MSNDPNDPMTRRLTDVTNIGNATISETTFGKVLGGYAHRMQSSGKLDSGLAPKTHAELMQDLSRANAADAATEIIKDGVDGLLDQASAAGGKGPANDAYLEWYCAMYPNSRKARALKGRS